MVVVVTGSAWLLGPERDQDHGQPGPGVSDRLGHGQQDADAGGVVLGSRGLRHRVQVGTHREPGLPWPHVSAGRDQVDRASGRHRHAPGHPRGSVERLPADLPAEGGEPSLDPGSSPVEGRRRPRSRPHVTGEVPDRRHRGRRTDCVDVGPGRASRGLGARAPGFRGLGRRGRVGAGALRSGRPVALGVGRARHQADQRGQGRRDGRESGHAPSQLPGTRPGSILGSRPREQCSPAPRVDAA